ncbi:hypothetical protein CLU79DRAFT_831539 [Phycomyces nitens]|nr:hypothetical protein CLU79DRAFT_831539 [Phycomyces nitens]
MQNHKDNPKLPTTIQTDPFTSSTSRSPLAQKDHGELDTSKPLQRNNPKRTPKKITVGPLKQSTNNPTSPSSIANQEKQSILYKTEVCRNWSEIGHCRYGKRCQYAHGNKEIRNTPRHNRYKTQPCRAYHEEGACPYGTRCTYIHEIYPPGLTQTDKSTSVHVKYMETPINISTRNESRFFRKEKESPNAQPMATFSDQQQKPHTSLEPVQNVWNSKLCLEIGDRTSIDRRDSSSSESIHNTELQQIIPIDTYEYPFDMMKPSSLWTQS